MISNCRAASRAAAAARLRAEGLPADDRALMVYGRATAEGEGEKLDIDHAYRYLINDEGKVVEGRTIPADLYAFDDFSS